MRVTVRPAVHRGTESGIAAISPALWLLYDSLLPFSFFPEQGRGMIETVQSALSAVYPWTKSLHVISVIAWMAALFYLPRLFVYHSEEVVAGTPTDAMFQTMERRLLKAIMNPAMIATWVFGLCLVFTPGVVDWGSLWPWVKAASVLAMSWFHGWLATRRKEFAAGTNTRPGRTYRMMNEVPTVLMILIVVSVIVKY